MPVRETHLSTPPRCQSPGVRQVFVSGDRLSVVADQLRAHSAPRAGFDFGPSGLCEGAALGIVTQQIQFERLMAGPVDPLPAYWVEPELVLRSSDAPLARR